MFQVTENEAEFLRFQIGTLPKGGTHWRYLPYVFTEHGAAMLATVLNSPIAVQASIQIVRAFIRLRQVMATHAELKEKIEELEKKYDANFKVEFDAIREMMKPSEPNRRKIGIISEDKLEDSF